MTGSDRPLPNPDRPLPNLADEPYAEPFWAGTREEELRLQRCDDCGEAQFFPRPWCKFCGCASLTWFSATGAGEVYAHTIVRRAIEWPAFREQIPYVVGYVDLEEGPRMFTAIVECPVERVENGMSVSVVFDRITDDVVLPKFRPE